MRYIPIFSILFFLTYLAKVLIAYQTVKLIILSLFHIQMLNFRHRYYFGSEIRSEIQQHQYYLDLDLLLLGKIYQSKII